MTVKLLSDWGSYPINALYSSTAETEATMVADGVATADTSGGISWPPAQPPQPESLDTLDERVDALEAASGGSSKSAVYMTVAAIAAANVPSSVDFIQTAWHSTIGDGGSAKYRRVTVDPGHAGAVQSADGAWFEICEREVCPEMLGGSRFGVADAAQAVADCVLVAIAVKAQPVGIHGSVYRIGTNKLVQLPDGADVLFDLRGATLLFDGATLADGSDAGIAFRGSTSIVHTETLSADLRRGDRSIPINVANVQVGDTIEILSPALTYGNETAQHYMTVSDLTATHAYLDTEVVCDITTQQVIDDGKTGNIVVNVRRYGASMRVVNYHSDIDNADGGSYAIRLLYLDQASVHALSMAGHTRSQVEARFVNTFNAVVDRTKDFGYVTKDNQYTNEASAPGSQSFGYGVLVTRVISANIQIKHGGRGWHAVDFGRGTMLGVVRDSNFSRCTYAVSCHEGAWRVISKNNVYQNGGGIIAFRCVFFESDSDTCVNPSLHFISASTAQQELIVKNATLVGARRDATTNDVTEVIGSPRAIDMGNHADAPKAGSKSAGHHKQIKVLGGSYNGNFTFDLGVHVSETDAEVVFKPSVMSGGANAELHVTTGDWSISDIDIAGVVDWHMFRLHLAGADAGTSEVRFVNIKTTDTASLGGVLLSIRNEAGSASVIDVKNCHTHGVLLNDENGNTDFRDVIGNTANRFTSSPTISMKNRVNNSYREEGPGGVVVTVTGTNVNNNVLAA